jgi:general stress protein 26
MKTTTASADPKSFAKLQELVDDIDIAMVTTVTVEGSLRSRPMVTREFEDNGILWFFASEDSGLAEDLGEEQAVNVSYAEPKHHRYVSITGNASLVHDREKAKQLWAPMLKAYFPHGLDDPKLVLLEVRIETSEYWDASSSKMVRLFESAKGVAKGERAEMGENVKVDVRNARASG